MEGRLQKNIADYIDLKTGVFYGAGLIAFSGLMVAFKKLNVFSRLLYKNLVVDLLQTQMFGNIQVLSVLGVAGECRVCSGCRLPPQWQDWSGGCYSWSRSDNGTEFNNQELESYLKRKGIEHQRTTFFSPAQNRRCERANRSLIEGTRTLLIESGLPIKFWAEAMNTYTYLKNRTPSYHNTNKTPEEMFTERKPTVSHLKVFGCKVEFWTPEHKRSKFEKITKTGIFVGYSSCRKAYRICNPENFTITETRDVAFLENQKGAELLTSNEQDNTDYSIIKIDGPAEEETNSSSGDEESSVEIQNPASNTRYNFRHTHRPGFYYEPSLSEEEYEENSIIQAPNDTLLMTLYFVLLTRNL
ncbi:hypothetical protein LAZ67_11002288 [Cordylochernes scorpioides]|uniref:Integrase catalytic domain-containing protein n=1 Tax=Cordylochernes scorpioides TaxID=51811 RepID=A0ABY6L0Z0_9ARAC|nr:hypothetical protein LAZ67_11002288 [Cordylochernes scorpioides]